MYNIKNFYNILSFSFAAMAMFYSYTTLASNTPKAYKDPFYIQGGFGLSGSVYSKNSQSDTKLLLLDSSLSAGYSYILKTTDRIRGELEIQIDKAINEDGKRGVKWSNNLPKVLVNGYYDISFSKIKNLHAFFGFGAGISLSTSESTNKDNNEKSYNFSLGTIQFIFGAEHQLTNHFSISNSVHIFLHKSVKEQSSINSINSMVNLKYNF